MDCKITSTNSKLRQRGMTMAEMMIATVISSFLSLGVASLVFYSGRSFAAMANYVDLDFYSRGALDKMSREIRQTNRLISYTTNNLSFEDYDGLQLDYTYDPAAKTLVRTKTGEAASETLLTECETLQFHIFQRNPVGGTYNQYPTASASTCKLVQLNWICSRKILGNTVNTESVQSAKIVIRKQ